jgi:paraquat-inducible protein A
MEPFISCPECGLVQRQPALPAGGRVRCGRCGASLYRKMTSGRQRGLALAVAAAIVFSIANVSPIVTVEANGNRISTTILGIASFLRAERLTPLAALVVTCAVLMPALEIGFSIYLLATIGSAPGPRFRSALRLFDNARRYSMTEVFVVGTVVALARLGAIAHIELGWGLWASLALAALQVTLPTPRDVRAAAGIGVPSPARVP